MADYPSNSNKSKETTEEKTVEKRAVCVVDGPVKTRKRNFLQKAMREIFTEDIPNAAKERIIPAIKNAVYDIGITTLGVVLHVDTARSSNGSRVSYRDYYNTPKRGETQYAKPGYDFDDIVFQDRGSADSVLDQLFDILERYGMVRVADLYQASNISCRYTDNAYGWTDLRSARIRPVNDGWIIDLPKAIALK